MATGTSGRVAVVTGAGRGIGRETALRLSREGLRVALLSRDREQLEKVAAECVAETLVVPVDVTDPGALDAAFATVESRWGTVEVLVAAAGAGHSARVDRTTDDDWQRMLDLNLTAPFRCVRRVVPAMRESGWGRIVVIASTAARVGEPYIAAYTASKHGVLGLVRATAAELATLGVTVNAVCPGFVDTDMTAETIANIAATTGRGEDDARAALERKQPIGRLITPTEVADAVWFCVGNGAVTGQAVTVDGGSGAVTIERINPPELATPRGFSHAVVGSGTTIFLAGQTALNADGVIVGDGVVAQFRQALGNLLTALAAAGGAPADLASMTLYIVDMDDYLAHAREIGAVWRELAGRDYPAMAGIGVTRLWDAEALIEVQAYAVI